LLYDVCQIVFSFSSLSLFGGNTATYGLWAVHAAGVEHNAELAC